MADNVSRRDALKSYGAALAAATTKPGGMLGLGASLLAPPPRRRAEWMTKGSFGIMVHWIAPGPAPEKGEWVQDNDRAVDAFDVQGFLGQVRESGAGWVILTLGQNSGYYCSPNATMDRLVGPGHCSKRDLALEIAKGLHKMGKRFIAYLPAEVAAQSDAVHKGFGWNPENQDEFQQRYASFIREYSERFGKLCDGWWFDGCYTWPVFHNSLYKWPLWYEAARAGNPNAAVAWNDGSYCVGITKPVNAEQDFLSGEIEKIIDGRIRLGREETVALYLPDGRYAKGTRCLNHALLFIDAFWGHAKPGPMEPLLYTDEQLFTFVRNYRRAGGAVTLNVGIYQEGRLGTDAVAQLKRLKATL
ncbi:MAG: hypothetical protein NT029_17580 [Armatimonadetes bacterium]|nr:hypothetical protein [Armatimonadota bacterium]